MTTNAKRVESREMPAEIDLTASENGVYIRENIIEETRQDNEGQDYIVYCYDERFLTHQEYQRYLIAQDVVESIELKHENDIIDEYTLRLIEGGIL